MRAIAKSVSSTAETACPRAPRAAPLRLRDTPTPPQGCVGRSRLAPPRGDARGRRRSQAGRERPAHWALPALPRAGSAGAAARRMLALRSGIPVSSKKTCAKVGDAFADRVFRRQRKTQRRWDLLVAGLHDHSGAGVERRRRPLCGGPDQLGHIDPGPWGVEPQKDCCPWASTSSRWRCRTRALPLDDRVELVVQGLGPARRHDRRNSAEKIRRPPSDSARRCRLLRLQATSRVLPGDRDDVAEGRPRARVFENEPIWMTCCGSIAYREGGPEPSQVRSA